MAPDKYHQFINTLNEAPMLAGLNVSMAVAAVVVLGIANIVGQLAAMSGDFLPGAGDLTLKAALCAAVVVLWRTIGARDVKIDAKDAHLIRSTEIVTQALATSASSNAELRKIIEESVTSNNHLAESLNLLRQRLSGAPDCGNFSPTGKRHD